MVIYPDPVFAKQEYIEELKKKKGVYLRGLELKIRSFIGTLVRELIENHSLNQLLLIGGDIAFGVCSALGITMLTILAELLPGIPITVAETSKSSEIFIVTKAGGFGEINTLQRVIEKLENENIM